VRYGLSGAFDKNAVVERALAGGVNDLNSIIHLSNRITRYMPAWHGKAGAVAAAELKVAAHVGEETRLTAQG